MSQDMNSDTNHEIQSVLKLCGGDLREVLKIYEQQLNVLQSRAQVLMSLAGVVLTITGFSGQRIAGTSRFAQVCIITGLGVVLLSAIWIWRKVLNIRWMTSDLKGEPEQILFRIIERRDAKTKAYAAGGFILCLGFVIYSIAFAKMLVFTTN
jgi:hypothetical protein